jgi:serine/threonine protein kinase
VDIRFRVSAGPDKGLSFELPPEGIQNIGRNPQHNEICLHDPDMDRVHGQVEVGDGRVVLVDDSNTGTFVNGQRITRQELKHGDLIRMGKTELTFQAIGVKPTAVAVAAPAAASAAPKPAAAPAPRPAAATPSSNGVDPLAELSGTTLGAFEIGPLLGKGYSGVVFRARNTREDRVVALKVLHPDFPASEEEMQRFVQALKTVRALRHPNLTGIAAMGRTGRHCWIAREYVEGESVAQVIQQISTTGVPAWTEAFRVAVHGGRALYAAGQQQLIHRDVMPRNLLVRAADNLVKLADLGLARALAGSQLRQSMLRAKIHSEVVYLPPEQTQPTPNLDVRSDIYSLGAVVYALLTGRPPCVGKTAAETVTAIRETPPTPASQWQPTMPPALDAVVLRMLAKRPEDRFPSAGELLAELAQIAPDAL